MSKTNFVVGGALYVGKNTFSPVTEMLLSSSLQIDIYKTSFSL